MNNVIGERERANLVVQLARYFCIYIYIYPALMYAVISNSATTVRFLSTPRACAAKVCHCDSCWHIYYPSMRNTTDRNFIIIVNVTAISSLTPARQKCPAFA